MSQRGNYVHYVQMTDQLAQVQLHYYLRSAAGPEKGSCSELGIRLDAGDGVISHETDEEAAQVCNASNGHAVVHVDAEARVLDMALDLDNSVEASLILQLLLELRHALDGAPDPEDDVEAAAVGLFLHDLVVAIRAVEDVVKHLRLDQCLTFVRLDATSGNHVPDIQTDDVDGPNWRSVEVSGRATVGRLRFPVGGPIAQTRRIRVGEAEEVLAHDDDGRASRSHVLMSACVDTTKSIPVDVVGAHVGAEVANDHNVLWNEVPRERLLGDLEAVNGLVHADVKETCLRVNVPGAGVGHLVVARS